MIKVEGTRPMRPGSEELSIHLWIDSNWNAPWCTLMTVGDAGVDFVDIDDEVTLNFWELLAYLKRN
ncbi:hypothetical protein ES703_119897 [subsurface metagenome]